MVPPLAADRRFVGIFPFASAQWAVTIVCQQRTSLPMSRTEDNQPDPLCAWAFFFADGLSMRNWGALRKSN